VNDREIHVRAMRRALWGVVRPRVDHDHEPLPTKTPPRDASQTERR
jgi:hypothetical protein